ncbi:MAG: GMC family oxidoreductase [Deltaproteobacteria bacterium]|nr:GMC family oxidoreductase [Deltaproteobacteria bacterium]
MIAATSNEMPPSSTRREATITSGGRTFLGSDERAIVQAICEVATPAGARVGAPDGARVDAIEALVSELGAGAELGFRGLVRALDLAARATTGHPLDAMSASERAAWFDRAAGIEALHWPLRALMTPMKYAAVHDPRVYAELGVPFGVQPAREKPAAWEKRVVDARTLERDEFLEVDAVIVGSGAGGAPLARGLAAQGYAVLVLEEGAHYTRRDFTGHALPTVRKLYQGGGTMMAWGNATMPVLAGKTVGGSTTVNSGTCFRTPDDVLREWVAETGLEGLGPDALAPHFASVEKMLGVAPNPMDVLGGNARIVVRGAEALRWSHAPLPRNAPGCDGQGLCCFGCPTDAKRSTAVSYLPKAVAAGAMVYAGARVERVLARGGRATGVLAEATREDGRVVRIRVAASVVVVAGGAIPSPLLLLRSGLGNGSGQVGRNLSLHPASYSTAMFGERIDGFRGVPQGYGVHEHHHEGIMMEGLFVPPDILGSSAESHGREWSRFVDRMEHVAAFGFMIRDRSRGRVRGGPGGRPLITYRMEERDRALVFEGHRRLAELFLAAGADEVRPGVKGQPVLRSRADLERFAQSGRRYGGSDLGLSSFHPLGTCRMGSDPRRSVVGAELESHDVSGLFVVDGSVLPGAPGVNPQVTIMALAERAVGGVGRRIDQVQRGGAAAGGSKGAATVRGHMRAVESAEVEAPRDVAVAAKAKVAWTFAEIMAGGIREVREAVTRDLTLTLDVAFVELAQQLRCLWSGGGRLVAELSGVVEFGGLAHGRPCTGSLSWAPLGGRRALVYELAFAADDGRRLIVRGEKHVLVPRILRGATHLHTTVIEQESGMVVGQGLLTFDLWTMPSFLRSFALTTPRERVSGA